MKKILINGKLEASNIALGCMRMWSVDDLGVEKIVDSAPCVLHFIKFTVCS